MCKCCRYSKETGTCQRSDFEQRVYNDIYVVVDGGGSLMANLDDVVSIGKQRLNQRWLLNLASPSRVNVLLTEKNARAYCI